MMLMMSFPPHKFAGPYVGIDREMIAILSAVTFVIRYTKMVLLTSVILSSF